MCIVMTEHTYKRIFLNSWRWRRDCTDKIGMPVRISRVVSCTYISFRVIEIHILIGAFLFPEETSTGSILLTSSNTYVTTVVCIVLNTSISGFQCSQGVKTPILRNSCPRWTFRGNIFRPEILMNNEHIQRFVE